jgi:NADH-quinone oxidoreductase subunit A
MHYDFANIMFFLTAAAIFVVFNLILGSLFRRDRYEKEKMAVYECGEPAIGSSWIRYNVRFYRLALVFLVFEVEIAFLFPVAVVLKRLGWLGFTEVFVFVLVLALALVYAWRFGSLNWVTSAPESESETPEESA